MPQSTQHKPDWETDLAEAADYLRDKAIDEPRVNYWVSVMTSFIGWEHPVREMLDVLVDINGLANDEAYWGARPR